MKHKIIALLSTCFFFNLYSINITLKSNITRADKKVFFDRRYTESSYIPFKKNVARWATSCIDFENEQVKEIDLPQNSDIQFLIKNRHKETSTHNFKSLGKKIPLDDSLHGCTIIIHNDKYEIIRK